MFKLMDKKRNVQKYSALAAASLNIISGCLKEVQWTFDKQFRDQFNLKELLDRSCGQILGSNS